MEKLYGVNGLISRWGAKNLQFDQNFDADVF